MALGARLLFERRLSATGQVSCATCHDLEGGSGTIAAPFARGVYGGLGTRNPPTVWNAALRSALLWDGRADSLEAQARGPLTNPAEMAMTPTSAVAALLAVPQYRQDFAEAFAAGDGPRSARTRADGRAGRRRGRVSRVVDRSAAAAAASRYARLPVSCLTRVRARSPRARAGRARARARVPT